MSKQHICKFLLIFIDFFNIFISFVFALYILYGWSGNIYVFIPFEQFQERIGIHIILSFICVAWFWIRLRHYTYRKPFWFEIKEIIRTLIIISIVELAIVAFSKFYFSRYLWVLSWGIALFLVPLGRIFIKKLLIKIGWCVRNTIIIGGGKNAVDAYMALMSEPYLGLNVKYFIASNPINKLKKFNVRILDQKIADIWQKIINKEDQFIIALEEEEVELRDYWLRYFSRYHYRSVSLIPTLRGLPLYSTDMSFLFSYDVILLRINHNLAKRSSRVIKRTMDIVCSLFGLIILSPALLVLSLIIRKDGGEAIYKHTRVGHNGVEFECLKFRSMVVNSDKVLNDLLDSDLNSRLEWEKDFKLKNDPRITKIGRFLRRTSLDELPQLWNVLKGEMSLVGPRPIVREELERYQNEVDYYLMAKPGMTGLWQVSGRNNIDYETRVYFDTWYVKNWSLWNDIVILFKTVSAVLKRNGAY